MATVLRQWRATGPETVGSATILGHSRSGVDEGLFVHMRVRARDIEQRQPCVRVLVDGVGRGTERLAQGGGFATCYRLG